MAFGPITSWQTEGEKVKAVADFLFLGSKITADGNCSHVSKRCLLLGRKAMTSLDSILENRDITFLTKVHIVSSVQFSHSVMSDSLRPRGLQQGQLSCPSLSPGVCSSSWCYLTITSSVTPFSCPQSFQASGSFPVNRLFALCGQVLELQFQQQSFQWIFRVDFP